MYGTNGEKPRGGKDRERRGRDEKTGRISTFGIDSVDASCRWGRTLQSKAASSHSILPTLIIQRSAGDTITKTQNDDNVTRNNQVGRDLCFGSVTDNNDRALAPSFLFFSKYELPSNNTRPARSSFLLLCPKISPITSLSSRSEVQNCGGGMPIQSSMKKKSSVIYFFTWRTVRCEQKGCSFLL